MTALRAVVGVLIVAVIGLGLALYLVASDLNGDVKRARADAARAQSVAEKAASAKPPEPEVTAGDIGTISSQMEAVGDRLGGVGRRLKRIEDCVPEVQAQIDSLDIEAGPYITSDQQVSRVCMPVVYGTPPGGLGE